MEPTEGPPGAGVVGNMKSGNAVCRKIAPTRRPVDVGVGNIRIPEPVKRFPSVQGAIPIWRIEVRRDG